MANQEHFNKTVELQDQCKFCLNSSYNIMGDIPPLPLNLTKPKKANFLSQWKRSLNVWQTKKIKLLQLQKTFNSLWNIFPKFAFFYLKNTSILKFSLNLIAAFGRSFALFCTPEQLLKVHFQKCTHQNSFR